MPSLFVEAEDIDVS